MDQQPYLLKPTTPLPSASQDQELKFGAWEAGLFVCHRDCVPNGLVAFVCPFVSISQISTRLTGLPYMPNLVFFGLAQFIASTEITWVLFFKLTASQDDARRSRHTAGCSLWSLLILFAVLTLVITTYLYRGQTRARFQIPGNPCTDLVSALCCMPCTLAQIASHIKSYTPKSCDLAAPDVLPAYSSYA